MHRLFNAVLLCALFIHTKSRLAIYSCTHTLYYMIHSLTHTHIHAHTHSPPRVLVVTCFVLTMMRLWTLPCLATRLDSSTMRVSQTATPRL